MNAEEKRGCCRGEERRRKARLHICQNFWCVIIVPCLCWFHHYQKVIPGQIFGEWRTGEGKSCFLFLTISLLFWKSEFTLQISTYLQFYKWEIISMNSYFQSIWATDTIWKDLVLKKPDHIINPIYLYFLGILLFQL